MKRHEKENQVSVLSENVKKSEGIFVVQNKGLKVSEITELRRELAETTHLVKVAKNRLMRLALKSSSFEAISDMFAQPTAVIFSHDSLGTTKVLAKFAKDHPSLEIVGGCVGNDVLDLAGVMTMSKLPSRDEARAKLVRLIIEPASMIARVCNAYGSAA